MMSLSLPKIHREICCGATTILYVRDDSGEKLGLWLVPTKLRKNIVARREVLSGVEVEGLAFGFSDVALPAWGVESLMQVKALSDDQPAGFAQGRTLRNSPTVDKLKFTNQTVKQRKGGLSVRTTFKHADHGWLAHHDLIWHSRQHDHRHHWCSARWLALRCVGHLDWRSLAGTHCNRDGRRRAVAAGLGTGA